MPDRHGTPGLPTQAGSWPTASGRDTPRGHRNRTSGRHADSNHHDGETLMDAIQQWQTPNAHGFTGRRQVGQTERTELLLDGQAKNFPSSRPGETTSGPGLLLQVWTPPSCPRLNRRFQAWLMRWPPWLTHFGWEATAWTRWLRQLRSALSVSAQAFSNP